MATTSTAGKAEDRREAILCCAAELLAEGGYAALSVRELARRTGMSLGLLYYYFPDKHAVFAAVMLRRQARLTELIDSMPRDRGLREALAGLVPEAIDQWQQVGRMAAIWRIERTGPEQEIDHQLLASSRRQFDALRRLLEESAAADGHRLPPGEEPIAHAWATLIGLAEIHTAGWPRRINRTRLAENTITALSSYLTADQEDPR